MSVRGYWFAFSIGVAAGAAVALLYAPQAGTKTRRKLRNQFENAGDYLDDATGYLKEKANRFGDEAQSAIKKGKKHASTIADSASDLAGTVAKSAKALV